MLASKYENYNPRAKERSHVEEARTQVVSNVNVNKPRWFIFKLKSRNWFKTKPHSFR